MPTIKINKVKLVEELYPRHRLDWVHVGHLADAIKAGAQMPPIEVTDKGVLVDGAHRLEAYRRVYGEEHELEVKVLRFKSKTDLLEYAARANVRHGLRLSPHDQARTAHMLLEAGLKPERVAQALSITRERLEGLIQRVVTISGPAQRAIVLKRPMAQALGDMSGDGLLPAQLEANGAVSGSSAVTLARQLLAHLKAQTYPTDKAALEVLWELIALASTYAQPVTPSSDSRSATA